jgi:PAS domain S-box-containing protein
MEPGKAHTSVLIVEDEGLIAFDLRGRLQRAGYAVSAIADNSESALDSVERLKPSIVLMDIRIRGPLDGIETADLIRRRFHLPVIFVTAHADSETLQRARITGPFGYMVKPFHNIDFHAQIEVALWKHEVEERLRISESWLSTTLGNVADALIATDPDGDIVFMNERAAQLTGRDCLQAKGMPLLEVFPVFDEMTGLPVVNPLDAVYDDRQPPSGTVTWKLRQRGSGQYMPVDVELSANRDDGSLLGLIVVFRDATERRRAEEQGRILHKMNALKLMAVGLGRELEQASRQMDDCLVELMSEASGRMLRRLGDAYSRSARQQSMVQQLIALGKSEASAGVPVSINKTILSLEAKIRRTVGSAISVELQLEEGLPPIVLPSEELREHLIALVRNAHSAMPEGGTLTISTRSYSEHDGVPTVELTVRDTGKDVRAEALPRVFDPWFQARAGSRGSGLSLALLQQFVLLNGGAVEARSGCGEGVCWVLSFPATARIDAAPLQRGKAAGGLA